MVIHKKAYEFISKEKKAYPITLLYSILQAACSEHLHSTLGYVSPERIVKLIIVVRTFR